MTPKTRVISTKVTEDEFLAFQRRAAVNRLTPSELARKELMSTVNLPIETRFVAAELLAFQETFLALILASLRGEAVTDQSVAQLRSRFDGIKYSLVERAFQKAMYTEQRGQM